MDSLTQAVLGACVGEAALGKKAGNKALGWGAVGGTIPDLDVLLNYFVNEVQGTLWHRTFSHSLFVLSLLAPLLGWAVHRMYRQKKDIRWQDWSWLFFWALITHPLLDAFTNYGTMLFFPFSDERISWRTIFIIDPVYTLPLLGAALACLWIKKRERRWKLAMGALVVSTAYLAFTCVIKWHVDQVIAQSLQEKSLAYEKFMTTPAFFGTFLWSAVVKDENGYQVGYYALTDKNNILNFQYVPQQKTMLQPYLEKENAAMLHDLIAFTEGYYALEVAEKGVILNDLRFGIISGWFDLDEDYIFSFNVYENSGKVHIRQHDPATSPGKQEIKRFIERIQGI